MVYSHDRMDRPDTRARTGEIAPATVRYIKLGEGGAWEQTCLDEGTMCVGFGAASAERFAWCRARNWPALAASFRASGRDAGTATRFANDLRHFCEADGSTLWITFIGESLYWGFADDSPVEVRADGAGIYRTIRDGWRRTDVTGEVLTKERLSGALTKLAAYRGTSCSVDVAEYVVRRINGHKLPAVERALRTMQEMRVATLGLIRLLTPHDFELLVDLVFTSSGWRRIGMLGRAQKTLDLDLVLPSTGERAVVQVKSRTSQRQLEDYLARFEELRGTHTRMFYVYHRGAVTCDDSRVTLVGPEAVATLVIDAGLTTWLLEKVS